MAAAMLCLGQTSVIAAFICSAMWIFCKYAKLKLSAIKVWHLVCQRYQNPDTTSTYDESL